MAVNLSPVGGVAAQFFTNNGVILSGGKIFTYSAGTTTNQPTYTSASGGIAHTNPIILDSAGRVPNGEIWLTDGLAYKFVITDSNDVLIGTYDNIIGINSNFVNFTNEQEIQTATAGQTVFNLTTMQYQPGTNSLSVFVDGVNQYGPGAQYAYVETDSDTVTFVSGLHVGASVKFTTSQLNSSGAVDAAQVSYDPPFVGSVSTNVEDKLSQFVSLADFGADATGVTDSATAINAAFNSGAKAVYGTGTFKIESNVTLPSGVCFYGWPRATITTAGGGNFIVTDNSTIENIDFDWNSTARRVYGDNASSITFKNCTSYDSTNNGFDLFNGPVDLIFENCTAYGNGGYGFAALGSTTQRPNRITVRGCKAYQNFYDGIVVAGVGQKTSPVQAALYARNIIISDCITNSNGFGNTAFNGITFPYSQYVTLTNCVTYSNTEHGIALQESSDFSISNCVSYSNGQAGLSMQSGVAPNNPTTRGVVTGFNAYNNSNEGLALKEKCEEIIFSGCTFSNNVQYSIRLRDLASSGLKSNAITFIGCAIEPSPGAGFVNSNSSTAVTSGSNLNFDGTTLQPNAMINEALSTALTLDTRGTTLNYPEFFLLTDSGTDVSRTALNQAYTGRRIILMADSGGAVDIRHNQGDGVNFAGFILKAAATVTLGAFESITFVGNGVNWIQVADNT
jgi:parallel beta-helix repeat protein